MLTRLILLALLSIPLAARGAITHEETASNSATVEASGTLTVTMAGAASDGEILVGICHSDDSAVGGTSGIAVGFPTGWTKATAISVSTTAGRDRTIDVGYKVASSEGSTYDFDNNSDKNRETQCVIVVYSDVSSFQLHVEPTASHYVFANDTQAPNAPSITTTTDNAMVLALATAGGSANSRTCGTSPPSGYTIRHGTTDPIDNAFVCVAEKLVTTAGAEDPAAFTITNGGAGDDTYAATIAISPAAAGNSVLFFTR